MKTLLRLIIIIITLIIIKLITLIITLIIILLIARVKEGQCNPLPEVSESLYF